MPRFYFNFRDGVSRLEDEEGMVLPDVEAAWYQAVRSARELIHHDLRRDPLRPGRCVEIEDEQGRKVLALGFEELFGLAV